MDKYIIAKLKPDIIKSIEETQKDAEVRLFYSVEDLFSDLYQELESEGVTAKRHA